MKTQTRERAKREDPEHRRVLILKAGRACLRQNGRTGFRLTRVASEAGVSISLVSHYFGGADELFMAIIHSAIAEERPRKVKRAENLKDASANLQTMVATCFDERAFSRDGLLIDLAIYEQALIDAQICRSLRRAQTRRHAHVAAILADVVRLQGTSTDPEMLADEFLSLVEGLRLKWCISGRQRVEQEVEAATCFLNDRLG